MAYGEERGKTMIKKIVLGVTIVLAACLVVFLVHNEKMESEQLAQYEERDDRLRPLNVKKREIEQQITELDNAFEANKHPKGTTQVIFTGLEQEVYTVCYPIMKEFEYKGILALSWNQLPGMEGLMNEEQFRQLLNEGWELCIKWDVQTPLNTWWPQIVAFFEQQKLEMSRTAYFVTGAYNGAVDTQLQEKGFDIVFHHGEENRPLIQTVEETGIWHLGAVGLMGEKPKLRLKEALAQTGNIAYLVGFELEDEKYDERSFRSMLGYFDSYEATQELLVLGMQQTRQHYRERLVEYETTREEVYKQERAVLEAELAKVEAEIDKVKAQED